MDVVQMLQLLYYPFISVQQCGTLDSEPKGISSDSN